MAYESLKNDLRNAFIRYKEHEEKIATVQENLRQINETLRKKRTEMRTLFVEQLFKADKTILKQISVFVSLVSEQGISFDSTPITEAVQYYKSTPQRAQAIRSQIQNTDKSKLVEDKIRYEESIAYEKAELSDLCERLENHPCFDLYLTILDKRREDLAFFGRDKYLPLTAQTLRDHYHQSNKEKGDIDNEIYTIARKAMKENAKIYLESLKEQSDNPNLTIEDLTEFLDKRDTLQEQIQEQRDELNIKEHKLRGVIKNLDEIETLERRLKNLSETNEINRLTQAMHSFCLKNPQVLKPFEPEIDELETLKQHLIFVEKVRRFVSSVHKQAQTEYKTLSQLELDISNIAEKWERTAEWLAKQDASISTPVLSEHLNHFCVKNLIIMEAFVSETGAYKAHVEENMYSTDILTQDPETFLQPLPLVFDFLNACADNEKLDLHKHESILKRAKDRVLQAGIDYIDPILCQWRKLDQKDTLLETIAYGKGLELSTNTHIALDAVSLYEKKRRSTRRKKYFDFL